MKRSAHDDANSERAELRPACAALVGERRAGGGSDLLLGVTVEAERIARDLAG